MLQRLDQHEMPPLAVPRRPHPGRPKPPRLPRRQAAWGGSRRLRRPGSPPGRSDLCNLYLIDIGISLMSNNSTVIITVIIKNNNNNFHNSDNNSNNNSNNNNGDNNNNINM